MFDGGTGGLGYIADFVTPTQSGLSILTGGSHDDRGLPQVISRSTELRVPTTLSSFSSCSSRGTADHPMGVSTCPLGLARSFLAPFTAHALDQDSESDSEGSDTRELFEGNFDRIGEDDDWIRELNEALGEGDALVTLPAAEAQPTAGATNATSTSSSSSSSPASAAQPTAGATDVRSTAPEPATLHPRLNPLEATAAAPGCHSGAGAAYPTSRAEPTAPAAWLDGAVSSPKFPRLTGGNAVDVVQRCVFVCVCPPAHMF